MLGKAQIDTSIICPYTEIGSLYFTMATSTGGELFYDTTNFANDVINHMYSNNGANYYDIISATGLKNIHLNGKLTRSNGIDTDGDGLTDWDETDTESGLITWDQSGNIVLPTFAKCIETEGDKYFYVKSGLDRFINSYANYLHYLYNKRIPPIKSDPTNPDSDGDGYNDNVDPRPLISDVTKYSLSNSNADTDFVTIYDHGNKYYGGDQGWFDNKDNNKDYNNLIWHGGCGTVAACNVLAYLELTNPRFAGVTNLPNIGHITKDDYIKYIERMANYIPPITALPVIPITIGGNTYIINLPSENGTWGVWPDEFISGIEKYCPKINVNCVNINDGGREFSYRRKYFSKLVAENLSHNVPVTICTGLFGNNTYYYYGTNVVYKKEVSAHWVDITELKTDNITGKSTLTISTWGQKVNLDLDEYLMNQGVGGGIYEFDIT